MAGALAALARKRRGPHPKAGLVYCWSLLVVFGSSSAISAMQWKEDRHLFWIGVVAFSAVVLGYISRKARWRSWRPIHIASMGTSYVALLTGFYVDNGPNLPGWKALPPAAFWVLPSLVGVPTIARALVAHRSRSAVAVGS